MRSKLPKVLHQVGGRPIVDLVVEACHEAGIQRLYAVVSPSQPEVGEHLAGRCEIVFQEEQKGTGHALAQVPPEVFEARDLVVVNADAPLLRGATIKQLVAAHQASGAAATLASVSDPGRDDGRIVRRPDGAFERIVEASDADGQELRQIQEVNVGLYCFRGPQLRGALQALQPDNRAGELYLTDLFKDLRPVNVVRLEDAAEAIGVNDRAQLARAEAVLRQRVLNDLMLSGVTIVDPATTYVDAGVKIGEDTVIFPFSVLRGETRIGSGCRIGPFVVITDTTFADSSDCGPFAHVRSGTEIGAEVHVGSFAEIVRSSIARRSRVPHVSYLGDATVGENVNIGAGTITANWDGQRKNQTVIEDDAFVGVDTMLRAPVKLGRGSRTGAGAVVTRDVAPGATAVGVPARVIRKKTAQLPQETR